MIGFPIYIEKDKVYSGVACIKMITDYYNQSFSFDEIKQKIVFNETEVITSSIVKVFEEVGYNISGIRLTVEILKDTVLLPCLIPWDQNHFVILYKVRKKNNDTIFYVANPLIGLVAYSKDEFIQHWHTTRFGSENKGSILVIDAI